MATINHMIYTVCIVLYSRGSWDMIIRAGFLERRKWLLRKVFFSLPGLSSIIRWNVFMRLSVCRVRRSVEQWLACATACSANESRKLAFWQKILIEINNVKIIGNRHAPYRTWENTTAEYAFCRITKSSTIMWVTEWLKRGQLKNGIYQMFSRLYSIKRENVEIAEMPRISPLPLDTFTVWLYM